MQATPEKTEEKGEEGAVISMEMSTEQSSGYKCERRLAARRPLSAISWPAIISVHLSRPRSQQLIGAPRRSSRHQVNVTS